MPDATFEGKKHHPKFRGRTLVTRGEAIKKIRKFFELHIWNRPDLGDVGHVVDVDCAAAVKVSGVEVALHVLRRRLEELLLATLALALVPEK